MLYMKLAIERAMAELKEAIENQQEARGKEAGDKEYMAAEAVSSAGGPKGEASRESSKDQLAAPCQPVWVTDSEWFRLSVQQQLAWARYTQDSRIAMGSQSPLEKKIQRLGGVQSSGVKKLLAREFQTENRTLRRLKELSFDFRFAQVESFYHQRYVDMLAREWRRRLAAPRHPAAAAPRREPADPEWEYLVPPRELHQIREHLLRAERARGLLDRKPRPLPQGLPQGLPQRAEPAGEGAAAAESRPRVFSRGRRTEAPKASWAEAQIQGHQDRMVRGRVLSGQRREAQTLWRQAAPRRKSQAPESEEEGEFEWVKVYPIQQPPQEAQIHVTILMEKPKTPPTMVKPPPRELLSIPPFLKSQLKKYKV